MARDRERAPAELRERDQSYYAGREPAGDYVEPGPGRPTRGGYGDRTLVWALAALAVGLLVWAIWATWWQEGGESAGPEIGITLSDITDNPSELYGSEVVVSGAVQGGGGGAGDGLFGVGVTDGVTEQFRQNAFVLGGEGGGVLVVGSNLPDVISQQLGGGDGAELFGDDTNSISQVLAGDIVQVSGTVQAFDQQQFENELGFDFGNAAFFDQWGGQPAIMAEQVNLVPRPQAEQQEVANISASALADNPSEFFFTQVQIDDATVGNVVSDNAFELGFGDGGGGNVIVLTAGGQQFQEGQNVTVSGIVTEASTARIATMLGVQAQDGGNGGVFDTQAFGVDPQDFERYDAAILSGFRPIQPGTTGG